MDDITVTIEGPDGDTDSVTLPTDLIDLFNEDDDPRVQVLGDVLQLAFTERAHAVAHHSEGDADERLQEIEQRALDLFEDRFGMTYAEATGHHH